MPVPLSAETGTVMTSPPQSSGAMLALLHLLLHAVDVGALGVDLVDRGHDGDIGVLLGVLEGFVGLRHEAVVGRDHEDRDVGDGGAARAHLGEGRVAGRVEEGDAARARFSPW
jgi:hypothetical protein